MYLKKKRKRILSPKTGVSKMQLIASTNSRKGYLLDKLFKPSIYTRVMPSVAIDY